MSTALPELKDCMQLYKVDALDVLSFLDDSVIFELISLIYIIRNNKATLNDCNSTTIH